MKNLTSVPDHVFIDLFFSTIQGAEKVSTNKYRGRCPVCGDSDSDKSKKRLYLLLRKNPSVCYCHNGGCDVNTTARSFFKKNFPQQWKNELLNSGELSINPSNGKSVEPESIERDDGDQTDDWKKERDEFYRESCIHLRGDNVSSSYQKAFIKKAIKYCRKRKIPERYFDELYVCYQGEFSNRIVFPVINEEGEDVMFQARDMGNNSYLRYHTKFFKTADKTYFYRFHRVDPNDPVIITEGLIDCLYFKNGMSLMGASLSDQNVERIEKKFDTPIFLMDHDNAGKELTEKLVKNGNRCFIWPKNISWDVDDVGDLVEDGFDVDDEWVEKHSYSGAVGFSRLVLR